MVRLWRCWHGGAADIKKVHASVSPRVGSKGACFLVIIVVISGFTGKRSQRGPLTPQTQTRPNRLHTHTHPPKRLTHPRSPIPPLSTLTSRATHAHPTSPRSTGFCAIWDCTSSSSLAEARKGPRQAATSSRSVGERQTHEPPLPLRASPPRRLWLQRDEHGQARWDAASAYRPEGRATGSEAAEGTTMYLGMLDHAGGAYRACLLKRIAAFSGVPMGARGGF